MNRNWTFNVNDNGVRLLFFCTVSQHQCSRTYLGRLGNGVISSYNYPFDYRDNLTCVYRIYLDSKPNVSQTVCLTFRRFSLENSSPFCSFDYVELGVSPPVKYCGAGLWQYGVEEKGNLFSNIWSPNLCCKYVVMSDSSLLRCRLLNSYFLFVSTFMLVFTQIMVTSFRWMSRALRLQHGWTTFRKLILQMFNRFLETNSNCERTLVS